MDPVGGAGAGDPQPAGPGAQDELKGVAGWLAFFCFATVVLGPLRFILKTAESWSQIMSKLNWFPALRHVLVFEMTGFAIVTIYGVVVGWLIWSGYPKGRKLAQQYLAIRLAAVVVLAAVSSILISRFQFDVFQNRGATLAKVIGLEFVYFLVWWNYFKLSRRVANTYGVETSAQPGV